MRTLLFILLKEFLQILRNRSMLPIIFVMPVVQMTLLSFAANYEIRNLKLAVIDRDLSATSRGLSQKMLAGGYFQLKMAGFDEKAAFEGIDRDQIDILLEIPSGFEKSLFRENQAAVSLRANAVNNVKAGLAMGYAGQIVRDYNLEVAEKMARQPLPTTGIQPTFSNWFNPNLDYKTFMVPGILAILTTMVIVFLTAINLVREKEIGTAEQLNVTPVQKWQVILGKILPFWLLGLVILTYGLAVGKALFGVPMVGSLWLLAGFAMVYLPAVLGLGILISTTAETQQQAMFTSWFFLIIFLLMSGLFTATDAMPEAAKLFNRFNPVQYFVDAMRMSVLKGATFEDLKGHFRAVAALGFGLNFLAIRRYRKRN